MKVKKGKPPIERIKMKTQARKDPIAEISEWWTFDTPEKVAAGLCSTAAYLKTNQTWRMRQLAVDVRLYCGLSVYTYAGSNVSRMDQTRTLPEDRPTFNLISSCVDTIIAKLTQSKPLPKFLLDNSDYKQRHLGEKLNEFTYGEFYQVKAYQKVPQMFRDGLVMGTGALKVYEGDNQKVCIERTMITDLFVDSNDSINGEPRSLYQLKLIDRDKFIARYPKQAAIIESADNAYPDNSPDNGRTIADQIMIVEGWRLASSPESKDGRHTIACVAGMILDEVWEKDKFPFVWFMFSDPFLGFFGQGVATQLFGTQVTLNRILYTISRAITLVGVPRVFQDSRAKVPSAHNNNEIGVIVKYDGAFNKPSYEVAPCNAPELYAERDKLITYGYQQIGVSAMQASSIKPLGLDSGEAQRVFDDISTDRMSLIAKKYDQIFIDLAYMITDVAMDIAKRDGKYQTIYPNKDGTKEIDLPAMTFLKDPFVIQCFNESSLPKDPAGRAQSIIERVQSGMITLKEGRRLLGNLDSDQIDQLANASEERIFQYLDDIVEKGKYTPPDTFMDLSLALQLVVQYINLYMSAKLEQKKELQLKMFYTQVLALQQAGQAPMAAPTPIAPANPTPTPQSQILPNTNVGAAAA
jgi:hypothetical protein